MKHRILLGTLLIALSMPAALAQERPVDPAQIDALFTREAKIEINVAGPLLTLVAEMTRDEPQFAQMLRQLRGVYVRQYELSAGRPGIADRVGGFARSLERQGWQTLVRVREPDQDVYIYHRIDGTALEGLVVMVLESDSDEATFVMIDGRVDPAQIGRLGRQFNVPALEQASANSR